MTNKPYNLVVYIGRFQPFHNAHLNNIKQAAELSDNVLVIIGSSYLPRTYKNPFTAEERKDMIVNSLDDELLDSVSIEFNTDSMYNDTAWAMRVQDIVDGYVEFGDKVALFGYSKDESSYYLKMFPQWETIEATPSEILSATDIRELYFKEDLNFNFINNVLPEPVIDFLEDFSRTKEYQQIIRERRFVENYKKQFAGMPYPPTFVTSDAVVFCQGHVLMIGRKAEPGKGLMALPGGFLNAATDKSVLDAAIRELKEETKIKVPIPVLKGCVKSEKVFDAIGRSARGRTITHAFNIVLPDLELPKVKGSDDALWARWIPLADIKSEHCFDDHYDIIMHFVGG